MESNCTTCRYWAMRFMDDAGAWGQCTNDKVLDLLFVSTAVINDIPQELREAIHKQASITYVGHAFGCMYHKGMEKG